MPSQSLDTSVVLRWLLADDPKRCKIATAIIESDQELHLADLALAEIVYVLERGYQLDRTTIADCILAVTARANINCNRTLIREVLPHYTTHKKLSFTDIALSVYAQLNQSTPLLTFDKALSATLPSTAKYLLEK